MNNGIKKSVIESIQKQSSPSERASKMEQNHIISYKFCPKKILFKGGFLRIIVRYESSIVEFNFFSHEKLSLKFKIYISFVEN